MSKYSDFKEWLTTNTAKTEEEKVAIFEAALLADDSAVAMSAELETGEASEKALFDACLCISYADYAAAALQGEIDALKAASKVRCVKTDPPKRMQVVLVFGDGWDHPVLAYQSPAGHWTDSDGYWFDDGLVPTIWMPIPTAMVAAITKAEGGQNEKI